MYPFAANDRNDPRQPVSCKWCRSKAEIFYHNLQDRMGSAHGSWRILRCLNPLCGLYWLDPLPSDKDLEEAYSRYYTHPELTPAPMGALKVLIRKIRKLIANSYRQDRFGYQAKISPLLLFALSTIVKLDILSQARIEFSVMYLGAENCGRLLDIGFGNGLFLLDMRDRGWEVHGCDVDPQAVKTARAKGLNVKPGTLEDQNFEDDFFDAITLAHVVEHLPDPLTALRECFRILKPGGKLVVVTPNIKSRTHEKFGRDWVHLDPPRHLHLFSPQLLAKMAGCAGFQNYRLFTTLRESNRSFTHSWTIQQTGRFTLTDFGSIKLRVLSNLFAAWHYLQLKRDPGCGEEIAMIAEKKGNRA